MNKLQLNSNKTEVVLVEKAAALKAIVLSTFQEVHMILADSVKHLGIIPDLPLLIER